MYVLKMKHCETVFDIFGMSKLLRTAAVILKVLPSWRNLAYHSY